MHESDPIPSLVCKTATDPSVLTKTILQYAVSTAIAATGVYLALDAAPLKHAVSPDIAACEAAPTARCLTEIGVALAMNARNAPSYMPEVELLSQMGLFYEAHRLGQREIRRADNPRMTDAVLDRRMASFRVTSALRGGMSLSDAVAQTSGVDGGTLWISALDLIGRNPYGTPQPRSSDPSDETRAHVAEMAEMIVTYAVADAAHPRIYQLVYAAELQAYLGNADAVIQILEGLPQSTPPILTLPPDARRALAPLRAQLGDLEAAIQVLEGLDRPAHAWLGLFSPDLPPADRDARLDAAEAVLSAEEHVFLRARLAEEASRDARSVDQAPWAYGVALDILQAPQLNGEVSIWDYLNLLRVAFRLGAEDIEALALTRMAETAFQSRSYRDFILAGFHWHGSDVMP